LDVSTAIEIQELGVDFGDLHAVENVSLSVNYGEVVALLGPNGAGKTTLTETLLGFRRPSRGRVRLHGLDPVSAHAEVVARTGALLQRGGVWFPMTPRQVLHLTATYYGAPRNPDELLDVLDLRHCQNTPWRRLSGGEQQRTQLALALLGQPKVLVLDEPTSAVDPEGRQVIRDLIASERARGVALLVTTHELTEAERSADRIVIMNDGLVIASGSLDELAGEPGLVVELSDTIDPAPLAALLGCEVTLEGRQLLCATATSPAVAATITTHLASLGVTMVAMRSRATLEERYLSLLEASRKERV